MKKHLLIIYILLANLTFVWDIKAHNNSPSCPTKKSVANTYKHRLSAVHNHPSQFNFTKNDFSIVSSADSLRSLYGGELLFSNDKISISSVYPNPASAFASIDYHLGGEANSAKIILCNVLGSVVGEYTLVKDARKLNISTMDLTSGVYFYSLYVDGKTLVTRKLIIKHQS
jgi:hypothetical protein